MQLRRVLEEKGKLPKVLTGSGPIPPNPMQQAKEQIARLAKISCTIEEISSITGIPTSQLTTSPWKEFIGKHRDESKASLRRQQLKLAYGAPARIEITYDPETQKPVEKVVEVPLQPSTQMAIHLGKNWLGQVGDKVTLNQQNNFGSQTGSDPNPRMSPETRERLAKVFLSICPEAAKTAVILDPKDEVQVA